MAEDGHGDAAHDEDEERPGEQDRPVPIPAADSWVGVVATPQQAMEWGIELCGQLAEIHYEDVVVGVISSATIARDPFGRPHLPEPDARADNPKWADVRALADAVRALVPQPPDELFQALRPPYASAVALGEELQDAQRAMGLPVAPIPFEGAPPAALGGFPLEVPPSPPPADEPTEPSAPTGPDPDVQSDLDRRPNPWALLAVTVVVVAVAIALGLGWR